jgi:hypothetical protein
MQDFFSGELVDGSHAFESEEKIVKAILKSADVSGMFKTIKAECCQDTGLDNISLSWFVNRYTTFPIWLGTRKVEWQRDVFGTLIKKFTTTPCYKAWDEVNDSKPEEDERGAGCVFTWPAFGVCCIHQYSPSSITDADGIWITRKMPSFEEKFVIEPLNQLLKTISWKFPG